MGLKKKVRQTGNSLSFPVPNEVFDFLELNPKECKYKLCQDDTGGVYIIILKPDTMMLDEKKFQKMGQTFGIIIPKTLCTLWNIGLGESQKRELEISFDGSPLKWAISPVSSF